jgi:hypothetical protein
MNDMLLPQSLEMVKAALLGYLTDRDISPEDRGRLRAQAISLCYEIQKAKILGEQRKRH